MSDVNYYLLTYIIAHVSISCLTVLHSAISDRTLVLVAIAENV